MNLLFGLSNDDVSVVEPFCCWAVLISYKTTIQLYMYNDVAAVATIEGRGNILAHVCGWVGRPWLHGRVLLR